LGGLVVAWFSRHREFRADSGGAELAGTHKMASALERLQSVFDPRGSSREQDQYASMKISGGKSFLELLSTHPPLEERIKKLRGF
jgi:heat shock protein HtpX